MNLQVVIRGRGKYYQAAPRPDGRNPWTRPPFWAGRPDERKPTVRGTGYSAGGRPIAVEGGYVRDKQTISVAPGGSGGMLLSAFGVPTR